MKKRILLIISAFLLFSGCGIPTLFNVTTKIETITNSDTEINAKITVTDTERLDWITPNRGPSLMLAYVITNEASLPSNSAISQFSTLYVRKPNGRNVITIDVYENGLFPNASDELTQSIFPFSDLGKNKFRSPNYMATAKDRTDPNSKFTLKLEGDHLTFSFDDDSYQVYSFLKTLHRYNGEPFVKTEGVSGKDYYLGDSNDSSVLYIHIFSALNVTEGDFNNVYWSELVNIGSIKLSE